MQASAAARRLGTYQPTLSRQIGELESQLGVPLFERTGRGLVATAAGLAIVDAARRLAQCPLGAFAARAYLQQRGIRRRLSDLAKHDLLGLDRDDDLLRGLQRAGSMLLPKAFSVRTDDQVAYAQLVEDGAGIGFLAEFTARRLDGVQAVLPRLATASMPLWLVVHR
jgi:DNA-binding transcriptional LysR family regulator